MSRQCQSNESNAKLIERNRMIESNVTMIFSIDSITFDWRILLEAAHQPQFPCRKVSRKTGYANAE